jgi:hypothetical protein
MRFMKYTVQLGSGAVAYIPLFIKIGSGIHKLIKGDTQTAWRLHIPFVPLCCAFREASKRGVLEQSTSIEFTFI